MSSASIYAEIGICQNQIDSLANEIRQLERKIETQEYVRRSFIPKQENFQAELLDKYSKKDNINRYQSNVVLSQRFQEKTVDTMTSSIKSELMGRLDSIYSELKNETQQHYNRLDELRQELNNAHSRMTQLHIDYKNALAAEEAARQAEAEHQRQLQNQNRKS